jgi:hypothetical protein
MLVIDENVFSEVANLLSLTVSVQVDLNNTPPPEVTNCAVEPELRRQLERENWAGVMGCYAPLTSAVHMRDPEAVPDAHKVWVRTAQSTEKANFSFIHELTHASQYECFGVGRAAFMMAEFNKLVGYAENPFEMEANGMAQFITATLGLWPIKNKE